MKNVVKALGSHGRLSFRELVLFSKVKPRAIRASLLVLSQHNLLWHSSAGGEEHYEFNVDECLQRVRFGKFLLVARELFGEEARGYFSGYIYIPRTYTKHRVLL